LKNPIEGSDWVGSSEILELDGLQGLFFIAEKFGKHIEKHPDDYQDDSIIYHFQEENKKLDINEELEKIAKSNKYIRLYLDNIKRTIASQEKYVAETTRFTNVIDEVLCSKPSISFARKRNLSTEEVSQVAQRLIQETDKSNIEKLLAIFSFYKFPFDHEVMLKFARQRRNKRYKIVENAIDALKHLKSKSIRAFALNNIVNSKRPIDYLGILISNYQHGDHKLLCDIAVKTNDEDKIERLARVYTDIYKVNKTTACIKPLEILYAKMNCAIHRKDVIELLLESDVLSDKIRKELQFDSNLDTREMLYGMRSGL